MIYYQTDDDWLAQRVRDAAHYAAHEVLRAAGERDPRTTPVEMVEPQPIEPPQEEGNE